MAFLQICWLLHFKQGQHLYRVILPHSNYDSIIMFFVESAAHTYTKEAFTQFSNYMRSQLRKTETGGNQPIVIKEKVEQY